MKKFWKNNAFVITAFSVWLAFTELASRLSPYIISERSGYLGPIVWANFDGIHYLRIAYEGYYQYSEAFFPLYPLLIRFVSSVVPADPSIVGSVLSIVGFFFGIVILYRYLVLSNYVNRQWIVLFILAFPTSFFFRAVYTEGLFFLLSVAVFVMVRQKQYLVSGFLILLAGITKVTGIVLLVFLIYQYGSAKRIERKAIIAAACIAPLGLFAYMWWLYQRSGDPLLFFHVQPAFGAGRSGGALILLPQVIYRYLKIIITAYLQPTPVSWLITVVEFTSTMFAYWILWIGWKTKEKTDLLIYAFVALTIPTLTGTFSSMPRYIVATFPLFLIFGLLRTRFMKPVIICGCVVLLFFGTALFCQGWFVA